MSTMIYHLDIFTAYYVFVTLHKTSKNTGFHYQTNIGILYQQTKLRAYLGKFWEPANHTGKS